MTSNRKRIEENPQLQLPLYTWDNPGKILDRKGYAVDVSEERWIVSDFLHNRFLDWNKVIVGIDVKDAMKAYIAHCIESLAAGSAEAAYVSLRYFLSRIPFINSLHDLTYPLLESAFIKIVNDGAPRNFHAVRKWYRWCYEQNMPGIKEAVFLKLESLKINRGQKNHLSVMTRDPKKGPFNDAEHKLLCDAVKEQKGSLLDRVCIMLLLELGARPSELTLLKEEDFHIQCSPSGQKFYSLYIPRAKQKIVNGHEKKRRAISSTLGQAIEQLIDENHYSYGPHGSEMPLICCKRIKLRKLPATAKEKYSLHIRAMNLQTRIRRYAHKIKLISPRTGDVINLFPYRFRYTLATRLAEQGAPPIIIAELLGHSVLSSVNVYVAGTSKTAARLNETIGKQDQYSDIVNRFLGRISNKPATEDTAAVIQGITPTMKNLGGIGKCGANELCKLYPPLSCYICPQFIAWKDGPHKEMLDQLEIYAESLRKQSGALSDRIPNRLEDVTAAMRAVVRLTSR